MWDRPGRIAVQIAIVIIVTGLQEVRGVAWDGDTRRLFVAEHDPDESDGITHLVRIYDLSGE